MHIYIVLRGAPASEARTGEARVDVRRPNPCSRPQRQGVSHTVKSRPYPVHGNRITLSFINDKFELLLL